MALDARLAYIENEILQADPIRLIQLLYRGAIDAVGKARTHVREGDIPARSNQITKASNIVTELALSLDRDQGGELAVNLAELYDYIQRRLQDANFRQIEEPLAEVERLLTTLLEAWDQCAPGTVAQQHTKPLEAQPTRQTQPPPAHIDQEVSYAPRRASGYY